MFVLKCTNMVNYTKEELEKLIFEQKVSYRELGRVNDVSDTYIKKYARKLGIQLPVRSNVPERFVPFNKGKKKKVAENGSWVFSDEWDKFCKFCNKAVKRGVFCSFKCMGENKKGETYKKYKASVENNEDIAPYSSIYRFKRYIIEEQNNLCAICKIPDTWNDKNLVLILDHINGDASNNKRDNLRCICPNCDSQLDTFKSKNKNSARKDRYLKNYK